MIISFKMKAILLLMLSSYCAADPINITSRSFFVDQLNGSDAYDGSAGKPFKTITKALNSEAACSNIYVSGGTYDETNGEVFPLDFPYQTTLLYNSAEDNIPVLIKGSGLSEKANGNRAAVILNGNSRIGPVTIDSEDNIGIINFQGLNRVLNSTIENNKVGVGSLNSSQFVSLGSTYTNNSNAAIEASGESEIVLLNNKIISNNIGITLSNDSNISFKHETLSGGNLLQKNKSCDFFYDGNKNIDLDEITWDQDKFDFTISNECADGNNIASKGAGSISYQQVPSIDQLLFNTNVRINQISPLFGETIFSKEPRFTYNANSNKLVMIAVWNNLPKVLDNVIKNPSDVVWFWHSGMQNSPLGSVKFEDGKIPLDEDLNPRSFTSLNDPVPLEKGRSYYWAIWEWDSSGTGITGSSTVSYFKVSENISLASGKKQVVSLAKQVSFFDKGSLVLRDEADQNDYLCKTSEPSGGGAINEELLAILLLLFFGYKFVRGSESTP